MSSPLSIFQDDDGSLDLRKYSKTKNQKEKRLENSKIRRKSDFGNFEKIFGIKTFWDKSQVTGGGVKNDNFFKKYKILF